MTSLLNAPSRTTAPTPRPRSLALVAPLGGMAAALVPLVACLSVGVIGWFLSDAGVHGSTRDGLRTGAQAWLMAHGSGVAVRAATVTVVPLGLTLLAAWSVWRVGHLVGDMVSGHGPDADRIADGERDWTVPTTVGLFAVGYAVVAVVTASLAAGSAEPAVGRVVGGALLLTLVAAAPAIAIGSGRAAIWAAVLPATVRHGAVAGLSVVGWFLGLACVVLLLGLGLGIGEAASMMSRLHLSPGEAVLYTLVNGAFLPNAALFSGSWLLGPGFMVGSGTLVSPTVVVLGPLPMFPLLAALPVPGATSVLVASVVALPPLVAALAVARTQRRRPTQRWDEGALRGCGGGIVAGVLVAVLAGLAGGAAGPGRMREVGPPAFDVMVHAVTAFGIGGLLGGVAMTWWQRRTARRAQAAEDGS